MNNTEYRNYEPAELEFVEVAASDIICTSDLPGSITPAKPGDIW